MVCRCTSMIKKGRFAVFYTANMAKISFTNVALLVAIIGSFVPRRSSFFFWNGPPLVMYCVRRRFGQIHWSLIIFIAFLFSFVCFFRYVAEWSKIFERIRALRPNLQFSDARMIVVVCDRIWKVYKFCFSRCFTTFAFYSLLYSFL